MCKCSSERPVSIGANVLCTGVSKDWILLAITKITELYNWKIK